MCLTSLRGRNCPVEPETLAFAVLIRAVPPVNCCDCWVEPCVEVNEFVEVGEFEGSEEFGEAPEACSAQSSAPSVCRLSSGLFLVAELGLPPNLSYSLLNSIPIKFGSLVAENRHSGYAPPSPTGTPYRKLGTPDGVFGGQVGI